MSGLGDDAYVWTMAKPADVLLPLTEALVTREDGVVDIAATIEALGEAGFGFARRKIREPDRFGERKHEPVCVVCRVDWPCREHELERRAAHVEWVESERCAHCKVSDSGWKIKVPGGGEFGLGDAVYHGRKRGKCRQAALDEMQRLGLDDLHEKTVAMLARQDRENVEQVRMRKLRKQGMSFSEAWATVRSERSE